jgi:hypothetical protein
VRVWRLGTCPAVLKLSGPACGIIVHVTGLHNVGSQLSHVFDVFLDMDRMITTEVHWEDVV